MLEIDVLSYGSHDDEDDDVSSSGLVQVELRFDAARFEAVNAHRPRETERFEKDFSKRTLALQRENISTAVASSAAEIPETRKWPRNADPFKAPPLSRVISAEALVYMVISSWSVFCVTREDEEVLKFYLDSITSSQLRCSCRLCSAEAKETQDRAILTPIQPSVRPCVRMSAVYYVSKLPLSFG